MSMLGDAKKQLFEAYKYANIDPESWERLQYPQRTLQVAIPMRHDNGELKMYKAFRSQFSDVRGPAKGGVRFNINVSLDEIEMLAMLMVMKTSVTKLPFGGAKGGIKINARELSHRELERLSKAYMSAFADFIGESTDVFAPDLGTDERVMGWMYSEYRKIKGGHPLGIVTGKPVALGGIEGRTSATGYGGYYVFDYLLNNYKHLNLPSKKDLKIAIQGFGQVGFWFAEALYKNGYKIVALSNEFGGTFNPNGLNVFACRNSLNETESKEWGEGEKITNEELLTLDVDMLVPAAIERVITQDNAEKIKASIVFELANAPTTYDADVILNKRKILVVPDILNNAGGVVVSYFEWLQNRSAEERSAERVQKDLKNIMEYATEKMLARHLEYEIPMRTATYALALKRIGDANECLGNRDYFRT